jgi:hypothetical protein
VLIEDYSGDLDPVIYAPTALFVKPNEPGGSPYKGGASPLCPHAIPHTSKETCRLVALIACLKLLLRLLALSPFLLLALLLLFLLCSRAVSQHHQQTSHVVHVIHCLLSSTQSIREARLAVHPEITVQHGHTVPISIRLAIHRGKRIFGAT